jgi:hypothetical protein
MGALAEAASTPRFPTLSTLGADFSSTKEFQPPHPGHFPSQREDSCPQL